jgi:hypothetical protein
MRKSFGDGGDAARAAPKAHHPLALAESARVDDSGYAYCAHAPHAPVPAGHGRLTEADYGRHSRERDPRIDLQSANDSEVFWLELESIHSFHRSRFDDRAERRCSASPLDRRSRHLKNPVKECVMRK